MRDEGASGLPELVHYHEAARGPFLTLSDLPPDEARRVTVELASRSTGILGVRTAAYVDRRLELESIARDAFVALGGRPQRARPHYMVLGECPWLATWYEEPATVRCPVDAFDPATLSFTYGDLFPTFSPHVRDGREYRGRLYTLDQVVELVGRLGLPQEWNPDGALGPERYVEVQVWADARAVVAASAGRDGGSARGGGGGDRRDVASI